MAKQFMHAFWGVGQMSFVKHAVFVNSDAPELTDHIANYKIYLKIESSQDRIFISEGIVDALEPIAPNGAL